MPILPLDSGDRGRDAVWTGGQLGTMPTPWTCGDRGEGDEARTMEPARDLPGTACGTQVVLRVNEPDG